MKDVLEGLGMDVESISDDGHYAVGPSAVPTVMDEALKHGKRVILLGRTSNDESGRVIFTVEENDGPNLSQFKGSLDPQSLLEEGVFSSPIEKLVEMAEAARKNGFALRLLGSIGEDADSTRVQIFKNVAGDQNFPQDFWLNRVSSAPNLSDALMQVVARRS